MSIFKSKKNRLSILLLLFAVALTGHSIYYTYTEEQKPLIQPEQGRYLLIYDRERLAEFNGLSACNIGKQNYIDSYTHQSNIKNLVMCVYLGQHSDISYQNGRD